LELKHGYNHLKLKMFSVLSYQFCYILGAC